MSRYILLVRQAGDTTRTKGAVELQQRNKGLGLSLLVSYKWRSREGVRKCVNTERPVYATGMLVSGMIVRAEIRTIICLHRAVERRCFTRIVDFHIRCQS